VKEVEEKPEQETRTKETSDKLPASLKPRQQPSALFARESKKAVRSPQRSASQIKENKHPFALYGWGEKQMDTGSQKTHNVCASASVHEVRWPFCCFPLDMASPPMYCHWASLLHPWMVWTMGVLGCEGQNWNSGSQQEVP
jgi:hypothetical protein